MFPAGDVDGDAFALVAVVGLDHDGQADFLSCGPCVIRIDHRAPTGHRHTRSRQQLFGEFLVLCDGFGDRAGHIHFSGLDTTLLAAPSEAHHAAFGHAAVRDATGHCRVHNRACAWPEADIFIQLSQGFEGSLQVKGRIVQRGVAELFCPLHRQVADFLLAVFHNHLVNVFVDRRCGAAEGHRAPGLRLQTQCDQLQNARQRHALQVSYRLKGADLRKASAEFGLKARDGGHGVLFRGANHNRLNGGVVAPQVGAA